MEQAVRRVQYPIADGEPDDFVIDYEIVEPPPPAPAERRAALISSLRQAEAAALNAIISPARERLMHLDVAAITRGPDGALTVEQQAQIDLLVEINARKAAAQRYFVNLEIEVEDLADETIEGWTFKPFGG